MGIGFAVISSSLNINGISRVNKTTWNIYLDNIQVDTDSVEALSPATITEDKMNVNFSVGFE